MDLVYGADFPVRADRDLTAVALVGGGGLTIIAPASLPANNLRELVGYARANPGKLNVGVGGAQSPGMLALWTRLGIRPQLTDVLYKGGQPAVQATVANEIQLFGSAPMDALEFIRAGRLKALAHFDNARYPQLPDVPAVSEAGIAGIDGTEARFYAGIWGPAKLSEGIVTTLNAAFVEATRSPEARERFGNFGMQPYPYGLAEVRQAHAGQRRIVEELLAQGVSLR
jgi:tripartite-type tricarboxylate transporter receptor subunit TctC